MLSASAAQTCRVNITGYSTWQGWQSFVARAVKERRQEHFLLSIDRSCSHPPSPPRWWPSCRRKRAMSRNARRVYVATENRTCVRRCANVSGCIRVRECVCVCAHTAGEFIGTVWWMIPLCLCRCVPGRARARVSPMGRAIDLRQARRSGTC